MVSEILHQAQRYTIPSEKKFERIVSIYNLSSLVLNVSILSLIIILMMAVVDINPELFTTKVVQGQCVLIIIGLVTLITISNLIRKKILYKNGLYAPYGKNLFISLDLNQIVKLKKVCTVYPDILKVFNDIERKRLHGFNQFDYYQIQIDELDSNLKYIIDREEVEAIRRRIKDISASL